MITRSDLQPGRAHPHPCPCGCAPCEDTGCELECHVRPRFFCGQLLSDEDLTAMVAWAARKFRLQRFRDGWGVACGLDVRCDPDNPQGVVIGEGYAVSCCGDDIVVCDEARLDLGAACRERDPCADPRAALSAYEAEEERLRKRAELRERVRKHGTDEGPSAVITAMREHLDSDETDEDIDATGTACWVDVSIAYTEQDIQPRATLRHSDCADAPECEPAKTRETYELRWELAGTSDPGGDEVAGWCRGYRACMRILNRFAGNHGDRHDPSELRGNLLDWIDHHRLHVFCDLRDVICSLSDDELAERHVEILQKLLLDCRIAYTREPCGACEGTTGVRLARVHLGRVQPDTPLRVRYIDNYPPFRRPLTRPQLPAPVGHTNLGSLIGARWSEACRQLAELGVRAEARTLEASDVDGLLSALDCGCDPIVACGEQIVVLVAPLGQERWNQDHRVIGFCADAGHREEQRPPYETEPGPKRKPHEQSGKAEGPEERGGQRQSREESTGDPSAQRRATEMERLKEADGIGTAIAERLLDAGLTLATIADAVQGRREDIVARVESVLPAMYKPRAATFVDELRRIRAAEMARSGAG